MKIPLTNVGSTNIYPYNIFTSAVNNNCLTINDGGISVEKCNLNNIKQQWEISPDENISEGRKLARATATIAIVANPAIPFNGALKDISFKFICNRQRCGAC